MLTAGLYNIDHYCRRRCRPCQDAFDRHRLQRQRSYENPRGPIWQKTDPSFFGYISGRLMRNKVLFV
jgi:hypothetical protein